MQNKRIISTSLIENAGCRISTLRSQLNQRTISDASRSYMLSGSPHNPSFLRGPHNERDAGAISSGPERNPGIFSSSLDVISLETVRGGEGPYFCTHCATPSSCLPDLNFFSYAVFGGDHLKVLSSDSYLHRGARQAIPVRSVTSVPVTPTCLRLFRQAFATE